MSNPDTQPVRRFRSGRRQKKLTAARAREFLQVLSESANVSHSALTVGVGRRTIYDHVAKDPEFAQAFETAIETSTDALVAEARRRALMGVEKAVYYQGIKVGSFREYSDLLTMFLIKARRPEYRDRIDLRHEMMPKLVFRNYASGQLDAQPEDTHATVSRLLPASTINVTPRDTEASSVAAEGTSVPNDKNVTEPHSNHPPTSQNDLGETISTGPSPVPNPQLEVTDDGDDIIEVEI